MDRLARCRTWTNKRGKERNSVEYQVRHPSWREVGSLRAAWVNRQVAERRQGRWTASTVTCSRLGTCRSTTKTSTQRRRVPAPVSYAGGRVDAHAALVITPEYNGIPAVIKNAIDWLSRPFGDGALKDSLAVIGGSMGRPAGYGKAPDETRKVVASLARGWSMRSNCRCRSKNSGQSVTDDAGLAANATPSAAQAAEVG